MKKVVSLVLALAMVASLCTAVFAAGSKTDLFEITTDSPVEVAETAVEAPSISAVSAAIVAAGEAESDYIDAEVLKAADALALAGMCDFTATGEFPCEITVYGEGTEDMSVVALALYEGTEDWEVVYAGAGGECTFEVEANGTLAIYVVE